MEAELSQLENPHLATVVSTQYNCSIFKTAFTPSFVIATSICFSYRNSGTGSLFLSSQFSAVTRPVPISEKIRFLRERLYPCADHFRMWLGLSGP